MVHLKTFRLLLFLAILFTSPILLYGIETAVDTTKQQHENWFAIDKAQHFSYSFFIALGIQYLLVNKLDFEEDYAIPASLGFSFALGVVKELQDSKSKFGYFSQKDLFANSLGLVLASLVILSNPT